jgi:hypothetical protein
MYDATAEALGRVEALPHHRARINAAVVLTHCDDTISRAVTAHELVATLERRSEDPERVRIYTIAHAAGGSASPKVLRRTAAAGGGRSYSGRTANIDSLYTSISSFF